MMTKMVSWWGIRDYVRLAVNTFKQVMTSWRTSWYVSWRCSWTNSINGGGEGGVDFIHGRSSVWSPMHRSDRKRVWLVASRGRSPDIDSRPRDFRNGRPLPRRMYSARLWKNAWSSGGMVGREERLRGHDGPAACRTVRRRAGRSGPGQSGAGWSLFDNRICIHTAIHGLSDSRWRRRTEIE